MELHIGISKNPSERFHDLNISTRKFQGNVIGKNLGEWCSIRAHHIMMMIYIYTYIYICMYVCMCFFLWWATSRDNAYTRPRWSIVTSSICGFAPPRSSSLFAVAVVQIKPLLATWRNCWGWPAAWNWSTTMVRNESITIVRNWWDQCQRCCLRIHSSYLVIFTLWLFNIAMEAMAHL